MSIDSVPHQIKYSDGGACCTAGSFFALLLSREIALPLAITNAGGSGDAFSLFKTIQANNSVAQVVWPEGNSQQQMAVPPGTAIFFERMTGSAAVRSTGDAA